MGLFTKKKPIEAQEKPAKGGFLKSLSTKKKTKLGSDSAGQETLDATAAVVAANEPDSSIPVRLPEISVSAEPCLEDSAEAKAGTPKATLSLALAQPMAKRPASVLARFRDTFDCLGIAGAGFMQAADACPDAVEQILEAAVHAIRYADEAKANRHNCMVLAAFLKEAVLCLDLHGQQFAQLEVGKANGLASLFASAASVVSDCSAEGWLPRMVFAPVHPEAFSGVHSAIMAIMQGCMPARGIRRLTYGDYRDSSRQFKRLLKRMGSGSAVAGIQHIQADEEALEEAAKLLDVTPEVLLAEIKSCDLEAAAASADGTGTAGLLFDGPIRDREVAAVFNTYMASDTPAIDRTGFFTMLEDLQALSMEDPAERERFVDQQFSSAGANGSGVLEFAEFSAYYLAQPLSLHRQTIRAELGVDAERRLCNMFYQFTSFGTAADTLLLDSFRFSKLCKDCGLTARGAGLTPQQVDVIFAKAKKKDARRLDFDGFVLALALVAKEMGSSLDNVVQVVLAGEGPVLHATQADYVKFHDDRSTYTGVYARGGMSVVDPHNVHTLSKLVNRDDGTASPLALLNTTAGTLTRTSSRATPPSSAGTTPTAAAAAARSNSLRLSLHKLTPGALGVGSKQGAGTPKASPAAARSAATPTPRTNNKPAQVGSHPVTPSAFAATPGGDYLTSPAPDGAAHVELRRVFHDYAVFGAGSAGGEAGLDGARFAKLCRETGLTSKALSATRVDLVFAKTSGKARRITFKQFLAVVDLLAEARGCSAEEVRATIAACDGPKHRGTTPDYVKYHDDRSTYTGVHARGGPTTVDDRITCATLTARGRPSPNPSHS